MKNGMIASEIVCFCVCAIVAVSLLANILRLNLTSRRQQTEIKICKNTIT